MHKFYYSSGMQSREGLETVRGVGEEREGLPRDQMQHLEGTQEAVRLLH